MPGSLIRKDVPALTGLRWIAAFLVILRHNPPQRDSTLYPVFSNGHGGVTVFFVLSGFVLTINYFDKFPRLDRNALKEFYVARIARIYPLYLVVLIGYGVVFRFDEWRVVVQHLLMVQAWSSNSDVSYAMNGPGWSLGVEAFFYLVFPFVIFLVGPFLVKKGRPEALLVLCISLVFLGAVLFDISHLGGLAENDSNSMWRWLYRNPAVRLGDFCAGIALASIYLKRSDLRPSFKVRVGGYLSVIALLLALSCRGLINNSFGVDFVFLVIACGIIHTISIDRNGAIAKLLSSSPLRTLGEVSYAAYLVHVPIREGLFQDILGSGFTFIAITKFIVYLVVVVGVSGILHYLVERPARRELRRVLGSRA